MGDLSIKNVPEQQIALLRARANRNHRSLQGELRAIIDEATAGATKTLTVEELVAEVQRVGLKTPSESTRWIRELRDRR